MHIWIAVRGEHSELVMWPEPRVLPHIPGWDKNIEIWRRDAGTLSWDRGESAIYI